LNQHIAENGYFVYIACCKNGKFKTLKVMYKSDLKLESIKYSLAKHTSHLGLDWSEWTFVSRQAL